MTESVRPEVAGAGREPAPDPNRAAREQIVRHHAQLLAGLERRTRDLVTAPEEGWAAARQALLDYVDAELLPHARGEERTLYRQAVRLPELALLVDSLFGEHRRIAELREAVKGASSPLEASPAAGGLLEIFRLHAEKENRYVVSALAADAGTDLEALLGRLHERSQPGEGLLDVRHLPPAERHRRIFATWQELEPGDSFLLVNDHDPAPLHYQLAAEQPGRFSWEVLEAGPAVWRVRIGRRAETGR